MSYPAKTKGFRVISAAGERCRWKFAQRERDILVTMQSATQSGAQQAVAVLLGHPNPWLAMSDVHSANGDSPPPRFGKFSPALVRRIIAEALALGWQPEQRGPTLQFVFDKVW